MDENVGRLLDYIDEANLKANTIVIYTSDNGFFVGEHGLYNKMWMYEESLHVPLLVRWPGVVKPKSTTNEFASMLDFGPTFLDIAAASNLIPKDWHGHSILPLLQGKTPEDWRQEVFYEYTLTGYDLPMHYGVRTHTHKLIRFPELEDYGELFDLKKDPHELNNVYNNPKYSKIKNELNVKLEKMKQRYAE